MVSQSNGSVASLESAAPSSEPCVTFRNDINLMDFVADVQEIYRAFTGISAQNSTFGFASALKKIAEDQGQG